MRLLSTTLILTQYSTAICLYIILRVRDQPVSASAGALPSNKYDAIAQRIVDDACRCKEPKPRKRKLPATKESRAASTSTRRRTASHAHEQAADGQEESDNLPNNDEVARAHGIVMSTDIHRPDGEVISNNTRLEKSVSRPEAGEARRRHHRQNDILLTSDSGIDGTDFPLEINCKIYCNSRQISEPKPAGRFLRRNWDLGLVESCINDAIEAELKDFSGYNLKRRSVIGQLMVAAE